MQKKNRECDAITNVERKDGSFPSETSCLLQSYDVCNAIACVRHTIRCVVACDNATCKRFLRHFLLFFFTAFAHRMDAENHTKVLPKEIVARCVDFLYFHQAAKLRTVSKFTSSLVSGDNMWIIAATIQERKEAKGKRVVLFQQYMMSREQAAVLPLSLLYK